MIYIKVNLFKLYIFLFGLEIMEINITHSSKPEISLDVNIGPVAKITFNFFHNTVTVIKTLGDAILRSRSQYCLIESIFSEPVSENVKNLNNAQLTIRYRNVMGLSDGELSNIFLKFYMDHVIYKLSK